MKRCKKLRAFSIILAALMIFGCFAASAADLELSPGLNVIDSSLTFSQTVNAGETFTFDTCSFDRSKSEKVAAISVTELPDTKVGKLMYDGREVLLFEKFARGNFDKLSFSPAKESLDTSTAMCFRTELSKKGVVRSTLYSIKVLGEYNYPPTASDIKVATQKNMPVTGWFDAKDVEGESLTYTIVSMPKKGDVSLNNSLMGAFDYKPYPKKTGTDKFTYQITDKSGNVSEVATVTINIKKPESQTFYQDLEGNGAHYAAVKLAEEDILVGEKIGGKMVFNPDGNVSKGDFLVMLMQTAELADKLPVSVATGFSDDSKIPTWMKSYVTEAVNTGIIKGSPSNDGTMCFNPDKAITRAEAAVMMSAVISSQNTEINAPVFGDMDAIPAWSVNSFVDLEEIGILHCFADGSIHASDNLTRIETAQLLWNMENYQNNPDPDKSFFDRMVSRFQ